MESRNSLGWKRPSRVICSEQGHLKLDHIAQNHIEPGLECLQGQRIYCPAQTQACCNINFITNRVSLEEDL